MPQTAAWRLSILIVTVAAMLGVASPRIVKAEAAPALASVKTWLLLLNNDLEPATVSALAASRYDMVVVDDVATQPGFSAETMAANVARLQRKADGSRRVVIAYLNVGQAENYRVYWHKGWRIGSPSWVLGLDPEGWDGNYPVAYWNAAWKEIIAGDGGLIDQIAAAGFDGVYLDWIGGFEDTSVVAKARRDGVDARAEMIRWVGEVSARFKTLKPGFFVIGQNATSLLEDDAYLAALDGVAQEDTWFTGADGGIEGDCPVPRDEASVGSAEFRATLNAACRKAYARDTNGAMHAAGESANVPLLQHAKDAGKVVFTVDYASAPENVAFATARSRSYGFVPFVGRRSLKTWAEPAQD